MIAALFLKQRITTMSISRAIFPFFGLGDKLVTEEVRAKRLVTCVKECESYLSLTGQCEICNCFVKEKTEFKNEACPLKKW